jgi:hypothetical protein
MSRPPDPEMRSPATGQGDRAKSHNGEKHRTSESNPDALDVQAQKLRRLYSFCHATAHCIASLAFAVSR